MSDALFKDRLRLARAGDQEALAAILESHRERIRAIVRRRLGPRMREILESSDLVQSVCMDAIRGIGEVQHEDEEGFVGWLARIVENTIRDKHRFFGAQKRGAGEGEAPPIDPGLSFVGPGETPSRVVGAQEGVEVVMRALASLPPDYRRIIELIRFEKKSHEEAAVILGKSEKATRMLLARARVKLLEALDGEIDRDD